MVVVKYILSLKEAKAPWKKMADYRSIIGNVQFEPGTFCSTRKQEVTTE